MIGWRTQEKSNQYLYRNVSSLSLTYTSSIHVCTSVLLCIYILLSNRVLHCTETKSYKFPIPLRIEQAIHVLMRSALQSLVNQHYHRLYQQQPMFYHLLTLPMQSIHAVIFLSLYHLTDSSPSTTHNLFDWLLPRRPMHPYSSPSLPPYTLAAHSTSAWSYLCPCQTQTQSE